MIILKLFELEEPGRVLESRTLCAGELAIGRDPGSDGWTLDDPLRLISRTHCVLACEGGRLSVRDLSSNGVRLDRDDHFIPSGEPVDVAFGQTLRLGRYGLRVERAGDLAILTPASVSGSSATATIVRLAPVTWDEPAAAPARRAVNDFDAVFSRPVLGHGDPTETTAIVPTDWGAPEGVANAAATGSSAPAHLPDAALLEAFCAGAKLDLSHFVGEDPEAVMRRLGELYRQMVLGLSDLMSERVTVKAAYRMNRTIVQGENNNPFKWMGAQKVATELLRPPADGFLNGAEAVNECYADLKKHVLCVMAGLRASVSATLEGLDPSQMKSAAKPGLFGAAPNKDAYKRQHAEFSATVASDPEGPVNRAFRAAYERRLHELDGQGPDAFGDRAAIG